jgi:CubicO group peptidase (beta-lactamase class C family)
MLVVTLILLLLTSSAIGWGLADWPFWQRVWRLSQLPDSGEWPESFYQPVAKFGANTAGAVPVAAAEERTLPEAALNAAAHWAEVNNSVALLVAHRGRIQLERYWQGMSAEQLFSGRAMSRSVLGFLTGLAVSEGKLNLDERAEKFLPEWQGEVRGAITLRQLLQNTSGLEEVPLSAVNLPADAPLWQRLQQIVKNNLGKNSRLSLSSNFTAAALSFEVAHEAGYRFALSNANAQILGVILERALGGDYERLVAQRLWDPAAAGPGEFYMDRTNGMPAVYCCMRGTPRGFLRLGLLLANDGQIDGRQVLPPGWVQQMAKGSKANPLYGLQIWAGKALAGTREYVEGSGLGILHSEDYLVDDVIWMEGGGGRTVWAIPSQQLVIVRLGRASKTWDASMLPNTLLRPLLVAR